jgi:hypothetical protein
MQPSEMEPLVGRILSAMSSPRGLSSASYRIPRCGELKVQLGREFEKRISLS